MESGFRTVKQTIDECGGPEGMLQSIIEHRAHVEKILARKPGPVRPGNLWAMDPDGYVHPRDPRHKHYEVCPISFNTPERANEFARHLSSKNWITDQSLMDFLALAATVHQEKADSGSVYRTQPGGHRKTAVSR